MLQIRARRLLAPGLAVLLGAFTGSAGADRLQVVAATTDLGAIADAVGGDDVEIDVVARPDRDLHTLEVRPSTMRKAARADIYLKVGMSLDIWSDDIIRGSRNRDLTIVDCSEGIERLEVPTSRVDASMGDVHPEGNPHYWLDPVRAAEVGRHLARAFAAADPGHADAYHARAEAFAGTIDARLPEWDRGLRGHAFVEYHRTWIYLAERFGMTIVGSVEPLPGIPPSARHLAGLADTIRERHVDRVVRDVYHAPAPVEFLTRETGVEAVVLPASCAEPTVESFLGHLDDIVRVLGGAASATPGDGPATGDAGPDHGGVSSTG